jgi:hypothetical protein
MPAPAAPPEGVPSGIPEGRCSCPAPNVIVALTSFGFNNQATGPGFAYRTDMPEAQNFLATQGYTGP